MPDLTAERLRLFAFTQADYSERYLAVLRAFDQARERNLLQLAPADLIATVPNIEGTQDALSALDKLNDWGLLERLQDDRRVRTIAEYRQRRSVYRMTELGWLAWSAVEGVLAAEPGEAELRRMVLRLVFDDLGTLESAIRDQDAERTAAHLDQIHRSLADLAQNATRFTLATSELSSTWEADPELFLTHKDRLFTHLDGFLRELTALRPALSQKVAALDALAPVMVEQVASTGSGLGGEEAALSKATNRWQGVVNWFVDRPGRPSQAAQLDERTVRAIRDLAGLRRRVLEATAGGISRATELQDLAAWFMRCPDEQAAWALAGATSGLHSVLHFGGPHEDPEATSPRTPWPEAPPAPIDVTLREHGRRASAAPARPIVDRTRERRVLRQRQAQRRKADIEAQASLVHALEQERPLNEDELAVLLRLLSRALHTRKGASGAAHTRRGRIWLRVSPAEHGTSVQTTRGTLVFEAHHVELGVSEVTA